MAQQIMDSQQPLTSEPDLGDATPPDQPQSDENSHNGMDEDVFGTGDPFKVRALNLDALDGRQRASHGRRTTSRVRDRRGRYVGAEIPQDGISDLALDATLRAASPFQVRRRSLHGQQSRPEAGALGPA